MEFNFNEVVAKAKDIIDVAAGTAEKAVSVQKKKINIASIKSKLAKEYEVLGRAYYESLSKENAEKLNQAVENVKARKEELRQAKKELANEKENKVCASCGALVQQDAAFCSFCGASFAEEK